MRVNQQPHGSSELPLKLASIESGSGASKSALTRLNIPFSVPSLMPPRAVRTRVSRGDAHRFNNRYFRMQYPPADLPRYCKGSADYHESLE